MGWIDWIGWIEPVVYRSEATNLANELHRLTCKLAIAHMGHKICQKL